MDICHALYLTFDTTQCNVSTIETKSKEEPFNSITLPKPSFIILLMNSSNERVIMRKINQLKKRTKPLFNNYYKMYTKEDNHPLIADQKLYKKSLRVCLFDLRKKTHQVRLIIMS